MKIHDYYYWIILIIMISGCANNKSWRTSEGQITEGLHDIAVIDEKTAVAYSYGTGNVYKTLDGGKKWAKIYQFDSIYFEQIQFLDANNGWIIGSANKIYKTQDGGKTWSKHNLKKESTTAYFYGMYFETKDKGYIAALQQNKDGFYTIIYQTIDGGESWESINRIKEMLLHLERIEGSLYATGKNVILKNVDQENWTYVFKDESKKVGQIRSFAQNASNQLVAVSFQGYVIRIKGDQINKEQITANRLRSIVAINDSDWIAAGDANRRPDHLFFSTDNAQSWTPHPNPLADIHRIKTSKSKIWMVGKEGLVMVRKM